ncbi:MAG: hypothetical protein Q4D76_14430, partial [Oscillospiraceae bacterium]|nr:hypothetical protein [Oscillospiraceae bacterium]
MQRYNNYLDYTLNFLKKFFKNYYGISTRYDLIYLLYKWLPEKNEVEECRFNCSNIASKWSKNGCISKNFFTYNGVNILEDHNSFELCRNHIHGIFENRKHILSEFENIIEECVFGAGYGNPFVENAIDKELRFDFEYYDIITFFSILLMFIQTKEIGINAKKYDLAKCGSSVKVYNKPEIENNLDILMRDAETVRMLQISIPSLMKKYVGFFKESSYRTLIRNLRSGTKFEFVFLDPDYELTNFLLKEFNYYNNYSSSIEVVNDSIQFVKELKKEYPGQVTLRLIRKPISYSYMQIVKKDYALFKIDLYTSFSNSNER